MTELLKQTDKYIQFEVEIKSLGLGAMFGGVPTQESKNEENDSDIPTYHEDDGDYQVLDEDGFRMLAEALGS